MNVDEALRRFAEADSPPRDAMVWALANWETASPRFISRLRASAAGGDRSDAAVGQIFFIIHLCGQMRETRAYEPLCRLIAGDPDLEVSLGDAITDTVPGILVNVFDGDCGPLIVAIESAEADSFARGAALAALAYLVRSKGALDEDGMRALLERLRQSALSPDASPDLALHWAEAVAALGYADLKMEVAVLAKEGLIDPKYFSLADFDERVALARSDPSGLAAFHAQGVSPVDDAIGALETWSFGGDEFESGEEGEVPDASPFDGPHVNPYRDVGRNDPCPCGSGKKYKKCCLAA